MHYSASTIILKRLVREISNNQNAKQLIGHSESLHAMERVIFCQIEASEGKTFYSTKKKNNLSKHTYNTNNCGGGEGGGYRGVQTSHVSYSVHELCIPLLFPFSPFSITKYEALFSPISTALTHLELPPPALSSCASYTTPAPYFPELTPPCPHPHKL